MNSRCKPRGMVLVLALLLSALVVVMATSAFMLLRPAAQRLDQRAAFDRAQAAADGALDEALARLDAGARATFERKDSSAALRVEASAEDTGEQIILVTAHARAEAWQAQDPARAWAAVRVQAWAARGPGGRWNVRRYVVLGRLFEAGGGTP